MLSFFVDPLKYLVDLPTILFDEATEVHALICQVDGSFHKGAAQRVDVLERIVEFSGL